MEKKEKKIVVPVDFTEISDTAINHAIGIAKNWNWDVILVHIINKETRILLNLYKATIEAVTGKMEEKVKAVNRKYNFKVSYILRKGSIFEEISKICKEVKASFVVMGTHGKHGMQHFAGSHAYKVITNSEIPFIVVQKRNYKGAYKKIVLPMDESIESRQKIKWAIYIAKYFDSKLFINVKNITLVVQKYKLKIVQSKLEEILKSNGIEYEINAPQDKGSFEKQTIDYAKKIDADIIMIMTNPSTTKFSDFILPKSGEKVLFNTEGIPVMCVNPRDLEIKGYPSF